jgi:hypothetical protein
MYKKEREREREKAAQQQKQKIKKYHGINLNYGGGVLCVCSIY